MSTFKTIKDKFAASITVVTSLKTFIWDDLSAINENRAKTYPVLLLKFPETAEIEDYGKANKDTDIVFYIFDKYQKSDSRNEATVLDTLEAYGYDVLDYVISGNTIRFGISKRVKIEYGHMQHNDMLLGVKFSVNLRIGDCRNKT